MTTRCLIGVCGFAGSARAGGSEGPISHTAMSRVLHAADTGGGYTTTVGEGDVLVFVRPPRRWPARHPSGRIGAPGMRTDPMERSQRPCPAVPLLPDAIF